MTIIVSLIWHLAMGIVPPWLMWCSVCWPGWWEGDAEGVVHCCPYAAGQCGGTIVDKVDAIMGECFNVAVVDAGDR